MVFKDYGSLVRLMFDPQQVAEDTALYVLSLRLPRVWEAMKVIHRVDV